MNIGIHVQRFIDNVTTFIYNIGTIFGMFCFFQVNQYRSWFVISPLGFKGEMFDVLFR